jgi:hypothetical protein
MHARSLVLAVALVATGCATAPSASRFEHKAPADPDRFERIACRRGELPVALDGRAFAQARATDLAAERQAQQSPRATEQLLTQRDLFLARCASWLEADASAGGSASRPMGGLLTAQATPQR